MCPDGQESVGGDPKSQTKVDRHQMFESLGLGVGGSEQREGRPTRCTGTRTCWREGAVPLSA